MYFFLFVWHLFGFSTSQPTGAFASTSAMSPTVLLWHRNAVDGNRTALDLDGSGWIWMDPKKCHFLPIRPCRPCRSCPATIWLQWTQQLGAQGFPRPLVDIVKHWKPHLGSFPRPSQQWRSTAGGRRQLCDDTVRDYDLDGFLYIYIYICMDLFDWFWLI